MTKAKSSPNRNQGLIAFLGTFALFLALFQVLAFIFFSNQADALAKISQEKETLSYENARLKREITKLTSLPILEEKAQKIGFITPSQQENSQPLIIYLGEQLPIASAN
jgi:cell division protein FtsB